MNGVVLAHGESSVDMSRADRGLPLLVSHNGLSLPIGRVEDLVISQHQMDGVARFGKSERASEVLRDIDDGIITDVSVGADILDMDDQSVPMVARNWVPVEVSVVSVGADTRAKIHRSNTMTFELATDDAQKAAKQLIERRNAEIERLFTGLDGVEWQELRITALQSSGDVDEIRTLVLDKLKAKTAPIQTDHSVSVQAGEDASEKLTRGFEPVLLQRVGYWTDEEKEAKRENQHQASKSEYVSYKLLDMARQWLKVNNVDLAGKDAHWIANKALHTRAGGIIAHSGGDFASLVANVANHSLSVGYEQAPTTWASWCATGSLPDFKQAQVANISSVSDVEQVRDDAEYTYGTADDKHELAQLETYGKLFSLGRKLIINDDLDALGRIPAAMGAAQARHLNGAVYDFLNTNAAMNEDSVALFHANHGNLTASGAAPNVAQLNAGFLAMGTQNALGPDGGAQTGAKLNAEPRFILVPRAIEATTRALMASEINPAEGATTSFRQPNIYQGRLTVVADAEMDDNSAVVWYLAADPMQVPHIRVFFLNGVMAPVLEQEEGFTRDGLIYKTRFDWDVMAEDFRGIYKNAGA